MLWMLQNQKLRLKGRNVLFRIDINPNILSKKTKKRVKKVQESDSGIDSVDRDSISSNETSEECQTDSLCSLDATEFQPLLCSMTTQIMSVENFPAEVSDASDSEISSTTIFSHSC